MKKQNTTIVYNPHDIFDMARLRVELNEWESDYISIENVIKLLDKANIKNMV